MKNSFRLTRTISLICTAVLIAGSFSFAPVNAAVTVDGQTDGSLVRFSNAKSDELDISPLANTILNVPSIEEKVLEIPAIKEKEYTAPDLKIATYQDSITLEGQKKEFEYVAQRDGFVRAELAGMDESLQLNLRGRKSTDEANDQYKGGQYGGNDTYISLYLKKGETGVFSVIQYENYGSFTLKISENEKDVNAGDYTKIYDSNVYEHQTNNYLFKAPRDGQYRFELADIENTAEKSYMVEVYTADGKPRNISNSGTNGIGSRPILEKGQEYVIHVNNSYGTGSYTLLIGCPKEIKNINGYSKLKDSTQFTNQENVYTFTAPRDGQYCFDLKDLDEKADVRMSVKVQTADGKAAERAPHVNGSCTVMLEKGQKYNVIVTQSRKFGTYTLVIGAPKVTQDITSYHKVNDSIEYIDQVNYYSYTAPRDGKYRFELMTDYAANGERITLDLTLKDADGKVIRGPEYGTEGVGISYDLVKGEKYLIEVEHDRGLGAYTLVVGEQKETVNITGKKFVRDSVEFKDQINKYTFVPSTDGDYRFQIEDMKQSESDQIRHIRIRVKDTQDNLIGKGGSVTARGQGTTVSLKAGTKYIVEIEQDERFFSYTLLFGLVDDVYPTAVPMISLSPRNPTTKPTGNPNNEPTSAPVADKTTEIRKFVDRIYTYVLNREPEEEGAAFWTQELYNFSRSGAEVAQGFIFSEEFINRNTSDQQFVEILYKTFFGRDYDDAGMEYWLTQLASGAMTRVDVANGFIFSPEWADTCAEYGIRSGGSAPTKSIAPTELTYKFVERMYTTAMGRDYDEGGRDYWANELSNFRITGEQVGASFFLSDEMTGFNLADAEFVNRLYKTFMDREADSEGAAYWLKVMSEGTSRANVVYGFTRSPEFVNKCIEARILPY